MKELTRSLLRNEFFYEPSTGWLIRKKSRRGTKAGVIGSRSNTGYLQVVLHGKKMLMHRVVWFYHFGWLPKYLDHINGEKTDNRVENLRSCTLSENQQNSKQRANSSGYKGVTKIKGCNRWQASIKDNGVRKHLGSYKTPEEAYDAYCRAADKYHGEFARYE